MDEVDQDEETLYYPVDIIVSRTKWHCGHSSPVEGTFFYKFVKICINSW